jgi:hypothetical protein
MSAPPTTGLAAGLSPTERALRLLRWIVIVSIVHFILLIPLLVGVIVDYHASRRSSARSMDSAS